MNKILLLILFFVITCYAEEPYFTSQWYINYDKSFYAKNSINKDASIHVGNYLNKYTGKGVKIAVIGDDLDTSHEDLQDAIIKTYGIKNSKKPHHLLSNHGTAVTGIIAARVNHKGIRGIAPDAKIIFLKHKMQMSAKETIKLFEKAAKSGADIINCSWISFEVKKEVRKEIAYLSKHGRNGKGIVIVFSVGNGNQPNILNESSIPEVIAVGATNKYNKRAWYSNFGKNLDVMAPGGNYIGLATLNGINHKYLTYKKPNTFTGTSAAAAVVSGVVALMLQANHDLTRKEIENILKQTADKRGKFAYINGRNDMYGYGKINLQKIMKEVENARKNR